MYREIHRQERRRLRSRNLKALLALGIWGAGCGALYLAWDAAGRLESPLDDLAATAVYLVTFFYILAVAPIVSLVDSWFERHRAQ